MKDTLWFIIVIILLAIIAALGWTIMKQPSAIVPANATTATTAAASHSTSSKRMATSPQSTSTAPLHERVFVTEPVAGATVADTFAVSGKAPGNWYFEATFPIQVRDERDNVIGRGYASAQGDWMTTDLVAFTATITIGGGYKGPVTLILLKDNPSGLPENDDSVSIPIVIK